jgi:hypothetical protein
MPEHRPGLGECNTSQSLMQSAPNTIAETRLITFRPGFAAPGRSPRSTLWSTSASSPTDRRRAYAGLPDLDVRPCPTTTPGVSSELSLRPFSEQENP